MERSTESIKTTHCGSLARPHQLLDLMRARVRASRATRMRMTWPSSVLSWTASPDKWKSDWMSYPMANKERRGTSLYWGAAVGLRDAPYNRGQELNRSSPPRKSPSRSTTSTTSAWRCWVALSHHLRP